MDHQAQKTYTNYILFILVFFSGAAALIYEVLWMKEAGLIFGNSAYAAATTLTAFFSGLAAGGYYWGKRVPNWEKPLVLYAFLELATAVCALAYFFIASTYTAIYPALFNLFEPDSISFLGIKFLLCIVLLFPAAFCIGGTLPVISHVVVSRIQLMGSQVSILYGINALGAGLGVLLGGFVLPPWIGVQQAYFVAMAINVSIFVVGMVLSGKLNQDYTQTQAKHKSKISRPESLQNDTLIYGLAFFSGLISLALQVFWNRAFGQVLQNSVYTFSTILIVFLVMLSIGAALANRLMKLACSLQNVILFLLLAAASGLIVSNHLFFILTDNLQYYGEKADWVNYAWNVFALVTGVVALPMLFLSAFFPYLLKMLEAEGESVGELVGKLVSINTIGAIIGSAMGGFVILRWLGPWGGIELIAGLLILLALILAYKWFFKQPTALAISALVSLCLLSVLISSQVQLEGNNQQKLLAIWQGSGATVTVIESVNSLGKQINMNTHYSLGGTETAALDEVQAVIPLSLHPDPKSVFLLGLGTGITAGAVLQFPIEKMIATELVPEVIIAAKEHFSENTQGLFKDQRVSIIAEDGRQYLMATDESYDVIIGDLFLPWKAGSGNLYTQEHFQVVNQRLTNNGVFMQWLPSHQITRTEFEIIAKTMLQAFPMVTLWRGDFVPRWSVVGLVGHKQAYPIAAVAAEYWLKRMEFKDKAVPLLAHYMGNLTQAKSLFADISVNTDDLPVIEYTAPINERLRIAGQLPEFAGEEMVNFTHSLQNKINFNQDPYLSQLTGKIKTLPEAGALLHQASVEKILGDSRIAAGQFQQYHKKVTAVFQ